MRDIIFMIDFNCSCIEKIGRMELLSVPVLLTLGVYLITMQIGQKFRLDAKVAIITGSSKGIGKAIAIALGQQGARVVISSRKQDAVDETTRELAPYGYRCYRNSGPYGRCWTRSGTFPKKR